MSDNKEALISFKEIFPNYSVKECGGEVSVPENLINKIKAVVEKLINIDTTNCKFIDMACYLNEIERDLKLVIPNVELNGIGKIKNFISKENRKEYRVAS